MLYPFKPVVCESSNSFKNGRTSSTDRPMALAASATNSCKCLRQSSANFSDNSDNQAFTSSVLACGLKMSQGHACRKGRMMAVVRVNFVCLKDCGESTDRDHTNHAEWWGCWGSSAWKLAWRMHANAVLVLFPAHPTRSSMQ